MPCWPRVLCADWKRVIVILAKTHIVGSWASKGSCPQNCVFQHETRTFDYEPGGQFLTTLFWRSASYLLHFEKRNMVSGRACGCTQRARIFLDESAPQEKPPTGMKNAINRCFFTIPVASGGRGGRIFFASPLQFTGPFSCPHSRGISGRGKAL